jgi:hypothetical protein
MVYAFHLFLADEAATTAWYALGSSAPKNRQIGRSSAIGLPAST